MKIIVMAKARAKKEYVEKIGDGRYAIAVSAVPERGRANAAITAALAVHFSVARSRVRLVSGATARQKIFEIL